MDEPIDRPPIQRVPAIVATAAPNQPNKPAMDFKRFQVARGLQQVKCITHRQGFVAVVIEPAATAAEAWYVGFSYLPAGTGAEFIKIINHRCKDTPGIGTTPQSLSISPEAVLAVAMGANGVRTFILSAPVEHHRGATFAAWRHLDDIGACPFAKWVGSVRDQRSLVTLSELVDTTVNVHGYVDNPRRIVNQLFRAERGAILQFDAAEPGNVAFVVRRAGDFVLYILTLQEDGTFSQKSLDLSQVGLRRSDVPTDVTPISLAVGNEQVVVGYSPSCRQTHRRLWNPPGLVEAYCIETGDLEARRLLPTSLPTALASSGTRLLIGASDACALPGQSPLMGRGAIYAMTTKGSANYTVCRGDEYNSLWAPGAMHMDKLSWCYARMMMVEGELATVIEYAAVPSR